MIYISGKVHASNALHWCRYSCKYSVGRNRQSNYGRGRGVRVLSQLLGEAFAQCSCKVCSSVTLRILPKLKPSLQAKWEDGSHLQLFSCRMAVPPPTPSPRLLCCQFPTTHQKVRLKGQDLAPLQTVGRMLRAAQS